MRLLLVEDDAMIGESVRIGLRQDGFNVDWVKDGLGAETALTNEAYDLMLLDLGLPRKSGLDVLRSLRLKGKDIPVLIITAKDTVSERILGLDTGADDYLVKPFDLDELAARIRAVLRRRAGRTSPIVRHAGLSLDTVTHEAKFEGQPLQLSAHEFKLLEILLDRPGAVRSREQLEEKLYGWEEEVGSNTIEVFIHAIRKKLGSDFIKNVRGVGYMVPKDGLE
jgi:two-component system response regulator QseB